jgi:biopolymer transport protein ExbB
MIRSFAAMSHAGAPDAIQLALGISEALVNTAGGLFVAIVSIVAYNFYVNKVDTLNYMTDEAAHEMMDRLGRR